MRAVLQRVERAAVTVDGEVTGQIEGGLLVLLGVAAEDTEADLAYVVRKVPVLRVFDDEAGHMNRSLLDEGGAVLLVSQFTLLADTRKGRRPAYTRAMAPAEAAQMVCELGRRWRDQGLRVEEGVFGAHMSLALVNDGPVTIILDSAEASR
jgi:D-aminoacyl-tRNA deacylase